MSNIYYGCINTVNGPTITRPVLDGNWNTVGNWYLTLGSGPTSCCCAIAATPAGRVPESGDSVVMHGGSLTASQNVISTGPSGGWAGPISWDTTNGVNPSCQIDAGNYSGTVTIAPQSVNGVSATLQSGITGGNFSGTVNLTGNSGNGSASKFQAGIFGGNFSGTVNLTGGDSAIPSNTCGYGIFGGTFTGTVTRTQVQTIGDKINYITGGTYEPTCSLAFESPDSVNPKGLPTDPGFALGGGSFAPVITLTGLPDILGTGLPL